MQSIFPDQKEKRHYCEAEKFERDLYIEMYIGDKGICAVLTENLRC